MWRFITKPLALGLPDPKKYAHEEETKATDIANAEVVMILDEASISTS